MEWQDEGFILYTQSLGERKQILSLFTQSHGKCLGVFSVTKKNKSWLQCGTKVKGYWKARLETHLGLWILEPLQTNSAFLLDSPGPLAALISATALCHVLLPERQAYLQLYDKFNHFLDALKGPDWTTSYVDFEVSLLEDLGYGLNFSSCAVTGKRDDLVAVSPRTGRAVCESVAAPYQGKLLPLPSFLVQKHRKTAPKDEEILDGLRLTGYFLERYLLGRPLPSARERLVKRFI
ncbi:MAG: DNA repair protein RecO [uncultured bacterium]|nr:MAG: DNA repair protein RecO [uncultured bacterium]OFW69576.1 MAG: DNA repair protein RecO [Alphaproteobacteria bacterium GWC2_42_16]OFW74100.1 MAG: DNA repair protein RecO [Alphaproteobacteria bacterium GWA2_41_27]OFW84408.1 MAG: DNA repair protein RecO [Alphaproteobacteria bacterium RIFCSPHIGHO2_12_FULL_42_100]OFW85929.1 MAG: DNA repair protein RecO [Alphaproteobacteria bacterium RBG_16_42_14]OFW92255.1 MAG: DNA repair protein RecO [Alphaproteobacteria bacterium RIFCSPHIGHO2_02_FULL_42_30